jgi:hypothetical protein
VLREGAELYRQVQVGRAGLMMSRAEIKAKPRPIDSEIIWRDCVDVASSARRLDPRACSNDSTTRGIGVTSSGGSLVPATSLGEVRRIQPCSKQIPEVEHGAAVTSLSGLLVPATSRGEVGRIQPEVLTRGCVL